MLEQRNLKTDLWALALLGLTLFLAASVLSYDPADPPSKLVLPERLHTLISAAAPGRWPACAVERGRRGGLLPACFAGGVDAALVAAAADR